MILSHKGKRENTFPLLFSPVPVVVFVNESIFLLFRVDVLDDIGWVGVGRRKNLSSSELNFHSVVVIVMHGKF